MVNAELFAAMKPGAIFINGGRGATVVEARPAARAGQRPPARSGAGRVCHRAAAALDSPLRTHPRVTPLPHIGSATHDTRHAMAALATTNLLQALAGERPAIFGSVRRPGDALILIEPARGVLGVVFNLPGQLVADGAGTFDLTPHAG
jgi:phosphoglycerate dehydrogenase-like enzyme